MGAAAVPIQLVLYEWAETFLRWLHVIAGVAWIGSSFYFIHLDLSLRRREGLPEGSYGEAWQVHGGGFYNMIKYLVAPKRMPDELTWFKWEAYTTLLSGLALLTFVYYLSADLYLIDRRVLDLSPPAAVGVSIAGLIAAWVVYDLLCRSPIGTNEMALALVGFVFLVVLAWVFTKIFSPRGAFMHMGAVIGNMMVLNVLMVIIPGQKKVVADLIAGRTPDAIHGFRGKQRSVHNNYLTLPVIFVMIGTHYPLAFASRFNWVILACILVMGAVIRHFYNERHAHRPSPWWTWGVALVLAGAVVWLSTFGPAAEPQRRGQVVRPISVAEKEAEDIVVSRCSMCHARQPVWNGILTPPKGVVLDTLPDMRRWAHQIGLQAVWTHAMPPGNITDITADERLKLATWIEGARAR